MSKKKLLGNKRGIDEVEEDIVDKTQLPPSKKTKREKLTKADTITIQSAIASKTYKVIHYKEDAHTSDYQFVLCVVHGNNVCDYAHDGYKQSKEENAEKWSSTIYIYM